MIAAIKCCFLLKAKASNLYHEFFNCLYFRLGLETMHQLTSEGEYTLRVELADWEGGLRYAEYNRFSVGSEADGYRLHIGSYHGDVTDALSHHNRARFSTYENDRDGGRENLVVTYGGGGGWWYDDTIYCNLNGEYRPSPHHTTSSFGGINWYVWKNSFYYSLKVATMKIRHTST